MSEYHRFWRPIAAAFDPQKPIEIGDKQGWYVERPDSPLRDMADDLLLNPDTPRKIMLTGQRGSGKSSELARLATELRDDLAYVGLDVKKELYIFEFSAVEVLMVMARKIHQALKLKKEYEQFCGTLFSYVEERGTRTAGKITTPKLLKELGLDGERVFLDRQVKRRLERPPVLNEIVAGLNALIKSAQDKAGKPLLVVVDGLDRVDLDLARRLFVHNDLLSRPGCHVVYAVPFSLYFSVGRQEASDQGFAPYYLPNLKPTDASNRALMRRIVSVRLPKDHPKLITRPALDLIVEMSGGVVRELIALVGRAVGKSLRARRRRIDKTIVHQAIAAYRLEKARELPYGYYWAELAQVQRTRQLTDRTATEYDTDGQEHTFLVCDRLLRGLHLINYSNAEPWYDLHPLIRPLVQARLEAQAAAEEGNDG